MQGKDKCIQTFSNNKYLKENLDLPVFDITMHLLWIF